MDDTPSADGLPAISSGSSSLGFREATEAEFVYILGLLPDDHLDDQPVMTLERQLHLRVAAGYAGTLAAGAGTFLLIQRYGDKLSATNQPHLARAVGSAAGADVFPHLLLALAAVVLLGRALAMVFGKIGQPLVIGELIAGVVLGPSVLGIVSPAAYQFILPSSVVPSLAVVSQLGVVLYMFLIGVELNPELMRGQGPTIVAISHASIIVPFVLGAALALFLYPRFAPPGVPFTGFALFIGIAMSITAFPVLARILSDVGLTKTSLATVALSCAAVDDVTAWCLLAIVVAVVEPQSGNAVLTTGSTVAFIGFMFVVARPAVRAWIQRSRDADPSSTTIVIAVLGLLSSALVTDTIGVHALFGAFLFGAIVPHESKLAQALIRGLSPLVTILLLPAFFAFAGMRTEIGLLSNWSAWIACALVIGVATVGKFGGTFVAARVTGLSLRRAAALGVLMNTRGLMQIIVLNVGLDLGVISPTVFTMMVLMALVTTACTTPLLRRFVPVHQPVRYERVPADEPRASLLA